MVALNNGIVRTDASLLDYPVACDLAARLSPDGPEGLIYLDLRHTPSTTTGALARLIFLRRDLLKSGRDLRIVGLNGRARALYEVYGLAEALPCAQQAAPANYA
jgi:ABC-type transporter Mla MlaB component